MAGENIGQLEVYTLSGGIRRDTILNRSGSQGTEWNRMWTTLSSEGDGPYQVRDRKSESCHKGTAQSSFLPECAISASIYVL